MRLEGSLRFSSSLSNSGRRRWSLLLRKRARQRKRMPFMFALNKSGFDGQRLQLAREFCDLTQKQLGENVAASHALVSLCYSGKLTELATDLVVACGTVLPVVTERFY